MEAYRGVSVTESTWGVSLQIARGTAVGIQDGRGTWLRLGQGAVWITQGGSDKDVLLAAGESFCIERDGLTLASPLGRAPLALVSIEPSKRIAPFPVNRAAHDFWRLRTPWRSSAGLV
jgi:Protein of unknown function (DUF2917)